MPQLQEATAQLCGSTIFSNLDMTRAYYNIPVAVKDQEKTALILPFGLYKNIWMPFGLTNAPKTWQRFIDEILDDLPFIFVYLDDILVFSKSEEEHLQHLQLVFQQLENAGLQINISKCHFMRPSVPFLWYQIDSKGFQMTDKKREILKNLPKPKHIAALRSQLGMFNFYHDCYGSAAALLAPFTNLLRGHPCRNDCSPINWTPSLKQPTNMQNLNFWRPQH